MVPSQNHYPRCHMFKNIKKRIKGAVKKIKGASKKLKGFISRKIKGIFILPVTYGKPVEEIISENPGKVHHFDKRITSANFPAAKENRTEKIPFKVFPHYATSEKALLRMEQKGYRPADIFELLQIAGAPEKIPRGYRRKSLVALGSTHQDMDGKKRVPAILGNEYAHEVPLIERMDKWPRHFRFIGVAKDYKP